MADDKDAKMETLTSLSGEFYSLVEASAARLRLKKNPIVEAYIAGVLASKAKQTDESKNEDEALIFRLTDAMQKNTLESFTSLGDDLLFITGYFPESFDSKSDRKYSILIGRKAYHRASSIVEVKGFDDALYRLLSVKFEAYSDVIGDVRLRVREKLDDFEIFELCKLWDSTKDIKIKKKLESLGVKID